MDQDSFQPAVEESLAALASSWCRYSALVGVKPYLVGQTRSTMDLARLILSSPESFADASPLPNSGEWVAVFAQEQSAGRGRAGRVWQSKREEGIYMTLAKRTENPTSIYQALSLAVGVGVRRFAAQWGCNARIKWPNDVLTLRKSGGFGKLAGILTEIATRTDAASELLIGVGFNLSQQEFPNNVPGISLAAVTDQHVDYYDATAGLAAAVIEVIESFEIGGLSPLLSEVNEFSALHGKEVRAALGGGIQRLLVKEVGVDGGLIVESMQSGERSTIYSGEVLFDYNG